MSALNALDPVNQSNNSQIAEKTVPESQLDTKVHQLVTSSLKACESSPSQQRLDRSYSSMESTQIEHVDDSGGKKTLQPSPSMLNRVKSFFKSGVNSLKEEASKLPERSSSAVKDSDVGGAFYDAFLEDDGIERMRHVGVGASAAYSAGAKAAGTGSSVTTSAAKSQNSESFQYIAEVVATSAAGAIVVDDLANAASLCVNTVRNPPKSTGEKQELAGNIALNSTQLIKDGLNVAKTSVILSQGVASGAATALSIAAPVATIPVQLAIIGISAKGIHDGRQFIQDAQSVLATIPQDDASFGTKGASFVSNVIQFFEKHIDSEITPKEREKLDKMEKRKQELEQTPGKEKALHQLEIKIERFEKRIKQRQRENLAKLVGSKAAKEAQQWLENARKSSTDDIGTQVEGACGIMLNVMRKSWRRQVEKTTEIGCSGTMIAGAALAPVTHGASLAAAGIAVVGFKLADCALHLNAKLADATSKKDPWSPQKRDEILQDLRALAEGHAELQNNSEQLSLLNNAVQMTDAQIAELGRHLIRETDAVLA